MRALPKILIEHPTCQVVIVGGDDVSYGSKLKDAPNWRTKLLRENPVDPNRVHFLGKVDYATYRTALQVSAAHIYLTYPFVLSWSLLEALACGCQVIASDTAPVREVIRDGDNGWLVDFFDGEVLVQRTLQSLNGRGQKLGAQEQAQRSAQTYAISKGIDSYLEVLGLDFGCKEIYRNDSQTSHFRLHEAVET